MLKPIHRISSVLFRRIFRKSKKTFSRFFRLAYTPADNFKLAVVVPKKIYKKRVDRNRQKRRIIHRVKELVPLSAPYSCIIWLQKDVSLLSSDDLHKEISLLLEKTPIK